VPGFQSTEERFSRLRSQSGPRRSTDGAFGRRRSILELLGLVQAMVEGVDFHEAVGDSIANLRRFGSSSAATPYLTVVIDHDPGVLLWGSPGPG